MKKILTLYFLLIGIGTKIYSQKMNGTYAWKKSSGEIILINFKKNNTFNYKSYSDLGPVCFLNKGFYIIHKDTLSLIYDNPIYNNKINIVEKSKVENKDENITSNIDFEIVDENDKPLLGAIVVAFTSKEKYIKAESYNGSKLKFSFSACDNVKYFRVSYLTDEIIIPIEEYEGFHTFLRIKLFSEKKCRYSNIKGNIKYKILKKNNSELKLLQIDNDDKSILSKNN